MTSKFAEAVYKRLPKNIHHDELTRAIDAELDDVRSLLVITRPCFEQGNVIRQKIEAMMDRVTSKDD